MIVRDYREVEGAPSEGVDGVVLRWVITKDDGAPNFAMRVIEVQPGCSTPHHQHEWEHEVFVIGGKGVVRGSQGDRSIQQGSVVFVPGNETHQFVNQGDEVLRFLCLVPHRA